MKNRSLPETRSVTPWTLDRTRRNAIHSNKYTWYSFIPKNLFEQFSQLGNAYFLFIMLLQVTPAITITAGQPLIAVPLACVILMGAAKDLLEDWARYISDERENTSSTVVVDQHLAEHPVAWKDVRPGSVLLVRNGERLPLDALLLATSSPDGMCSIETKSLDGETNLKKRQAALTSQQWEVLADAAKRDETSEFVTLECEQPSEDLYVFRGSLKLPDGAVHGVGMSNFLLRGTSLQQTDWVLCLAVYSGRETRVMMNSRPTRFKLSKLDIELGRVVLMIFGIQLLICLILAVMSAIWLLFHGHLHWYLNKNKSHLQIALHVLPAMGTWMLQTDKMVPISLMVTMTLVKYVQGVFISWDMHCAARVSGREADVRTSSVIESLGQVTHVFSDKTGTLTRNLMEFKSCSVGGTLYGFEDVDNSSPASSPMASYSLAAVPKVGQVRAPNVDFQAFQFLADLASDTGQREELAQFLFVMGVCHTVEGSVGDGNKVSSLTPDRFGKSTYQASSPDELALVSAARALGLEFVRFTREGAEMLVHSDSLHAALETAVGWPVSTHRVCVEILDILEFDNDRKRMSVVVRLPNGQISVLLKGADTSVLPHVKDSSVCEHHLWQLACHGLRTLCLASRDLDQDEYESWHSRYVDAQALISETRSQRVSELISELEESGPLNLVGATAIEDRLQDAVPETIRQMQTAGIRVWVLTGDKVETALSIGRTCKLLTEAMTNVVIDDPSSTALDAKLADAGKGAIPAVTVTGAALAAILAVPQRKKALFAAAQKCRAVLCCRVSPKQKADVVEMVKAYDATCMTLAIGDGANDVSMIVSAHVGVGLSGKEGAQAANAADFAISEFKMLRRIMFVHGRESYRRLSTLALYNFYKNFVIVFSQIVTASTMGWSGQSLFLPWHSQLYNFLYTHWPVVAFGILDRSALNLDPLESDPKGWAPQLVSRSSITVWLVVAFLQVHAWRLFMGALSGHTEVANGVPLDDLYTHGIVIFVWIVFGANITLLARHQTFMPFLVIPYAANFATLAVSIWMLNTKHRGHNIVDAVLGGGNYIRFMFVFILACTVHMLIGEPLIRVCDWIAAKKANEKAAHDPPEEPLPGLTFSKPPSMIHRQVSDLGFAYANECRNDRERQTRSLASAPQLRASSSSSSTSFVGVEMVALKSPSAQDPLIGA
mmetsp:Transcript_26807/g.70462  ORF Transcript_26807/g.70462 Transcript_26807/m.70462 type:complete len:1175 (-) Transcript_26807:155-3679(-)